MRLPLRRTRTLRLNTTNAPPTLTTDLTGTAFGGPFLHQAANNPHYVVLLSGDTGGALAPATSR